jgi:hypothetical protein
MIYKCICVLSEKKMTEAGTQPTPEKKKGWSQGLPEEELESDGSEDRSVFTPP